MRRKTATQAGRFPIFKTAEDFDALSAKDKQKVARYYDDGRHRSELRPLNAAERAQVKAEKKTMGRPKLGRHGVKVIALSVERDLLKRADAYAKQCGLKRSELVTRALNRLLPKAG
ncbi:MAG TPA: hypothetical protein VH370_19985 [Humisphaera sp.]|nr:hypothetical protein [Humisphaera sp.]